MNNETTIIESTDTDDKKYTLRELHSKDVFSMLRIIKKIGIKEFKSCFENEEIKEAIAKLSKKKKGDKDSAVREIGISVVLDIANVIVCNVPNAEQEVYIFLSNLSGMKKQEIEELDMVTFAEMIIDVFQKEEFADFFGVVSRLFK